MKLPRRTFLQLAIGAAALKTAPRIAEAQPYPSRAATIVVTFAAGGGDDIWRGFLHRDSLKFWASKS
jgi:tripartite-type tricarboxylate transporter receptor subunit TctC